MSYQIRPAKRSEAKPLIGLYAESGCGKTWSALMLARGFVGPEGKIVMLETEGGRGEVFADVLPGGYSVCSLRNEFSPERYGEAIAAIEETAPDALIIDSASHEWEGSGGVLAMAAQNEAAGKKSMMVWQGPKLAHQRYFVLRLLATPIPLVIVCMRAKYPMKEVKIEAKKEWVRAEQVEPVQSDGILYELMIHGWIDREHKFQGTKYTRDDLKSILKSGAPISIATGAQLAEWARGGAAPQSMPDTQAGAPTGSTEAAAPSRKSAATGGNPKADALARLDLARESLGYADEQWRAILQARLGTTVSGLADVVAIEEQLLPFLRRVAKKEPAALDELAGILANARAA